ncbi:MAG: sugar kinase, partial [Candidatus Omnitrophica bacterium]|nr:sugar kinase [Candidatus Omnitrophota bacterium]
DPTGAGDTFAGGMLGYLSRVRKINSRDIRKSLVYGSIMASFVVEDFGINRILKLSKSDISKRYREFKRTASF